MWLEYIWVEMIIQKITRYSFSSGSIKTDNIDHAMQHTLERGYLSSDKLHTKFGSSVTLYVEA